MVSTAALRWFFSMSQAATTWQSGWARNAFVLAGPIIPQPMIPTVIRSDAGGRDPRASAVEDVTAAAPAALRKIRRVNGARGGPGNRRFILNSEFRSLAGVGSGIWIESTCRL